MVQGVLFDVDGVLIDSEPATARSVVSYFASKGVTIPTTDFRRFTGAGERYYYEEIAKAWHVPDFDYDACRGALLEAYRQALGKVGPLPGVRRFLQNCHASGMKTACASGAFREKVKINLYQCGLSAKDFDGMITGDMCKRNKPFPDIYQIAASRIGLKPEDCMVMEDSANGLRAGKAAGCLTCGIMTSLDKRQLKDLGADIVIHTLDDFPNFDTLASFSRIWPKFV